MTVKDSQWHPIGDTPAGPEQEGLDGLRRLLPDSTLTHAWLNVEIRDRNNNGGEVDAIVLHANP